MASVIRPAIVAAALLAGACGDLKTFSGAVPPLTTVSVEVTGDLGSASPDELRVALVWGQQWLTEPLCILPAENAAAAAAIAAGCRDPFGFVPAEVDNNLAVDVGTPAAMELFTLPDASLLVGDLTARVGYASLVAYADRDGNGTLGLARANRQGGGSGSDGGAGSDEQPDPDPIHQADLVLGASFVTMTAADQRLGYREGAFVQDAFYPRAGCGDPLPAFSVLAAGGFSATSAIAATLAGTLPTEDPATCAETPTAATTIHIATSVDPAVTEVACSERNEDASVNYREPKADSPDFTGRLTACVHLPTFAAPTSAPTSAIELIVTGVVSGPTPDSCKGLTHYVLKGCRQDPNCAVPDWDHSTAPPSWWPC